MSTTEKIQSKANKIGMKVISTLGIGYLLVPKDRYFPTSKDWESKGTLFQINMKIERIARQRGIRLT